MRSIPTIDELTTSVRADVESQFGISIPTFGKNFLRIFCIVHAAKLKLYYLAIGLVQKNIWPDTADPEALGGTLERFGRVKLGRNPFKARAGQYEVIVTGTVGAIIKASTTFKSDDTSLSPGKMFVLDNEYELVSSTDTIILRALEGGTESRLNALDTLSATAPIALVDKTATVYAEIVEPLAAETIEAYRAKTLNAFRLEAQGGAGTDYRIWSADAQGVQKVYPYARSGFPCEINLFVEATIIDSIDGKGTPSAALIDDVEAVIEFSPDTSLDLNERGRRPLQVIPNILPVTIEQVDIEISSYVGADAPTQALLLIAITNMISAIRPFVPSADIIADRNDILDNNKVIGAIIGQKPGAIFGTVDIKINGVSMLSYNFVEGNIPFLNSVTYV